MNPRGHFGGIVQRSPVMQELQPGFRLALRAELIAELPASVNALYKRAVVEVGCGAGMPGYESRLLADVQFVGLDNDVLFFHHSDRARALKPLLQRYVRRNGFCSRVQRGGALACGQYGSQHVCADSPTEIWQVCLMLRTRVRPASRRNPLCDISGPDIKGIAASRYQVYWQAFPPCLR